METTSNSKIVAQGAATWNEKEIHNQIMDDLNQVFGRAESYLRINGYEYVWSVKVLSEARALEIVERGRHDEIMYMIQRYQQANCPNRSSHYSSIEEAHLPQSVQCVIAVRNNEEEMNTFLSYEGFGSQGQEVVLNRNNHTEIINYLQRHGFDAENVRRVFARNDSDEIGLQISRHGLPDELLDEMFEGLETDSQESKSLYYLYLSYREFSKQYQKVMLRTVKTPEFEAYVEKYGLWQDLHKDLVNYRLLSEVRYYLQKHPYLNYEGSLALAQKGSHRDKLFYISVLQTPANDFLWAMFKVDKLDYEALTACFLKISASDNENLEDIKLMKNGTHNQVMERIKEGRLKNRALAALFFRNNPDEFEAYLKLWEKN